MQSLEDKQVGYTSHSKAWPNTLRFRTFQALSLALSNSMSANIFFISRYVGHLVHLRVGQHVSQHVRHHIGNHNVTSTFFEGSDKNGNSKVSPTYYQHTYGLGN